MKNSTGEALHWQSRDGVLELTLDDPPANEIGTVMRAEFVVAYWRRWPSGCSARSSSSSSKITGSPASRPCVKKRKQSLICHD